MLNTVRSRLVAGQARTSSFSKSHKKDANLPLQALILTATATALSLSAEPISTHLDNRFEESKVEEQRNFEDILQHHKNQIEHYKQKWNYHNKSSRIPTVGWPTNVPDDDTIGSLIEDFKYCKRRKDKKDANNRFCQNLNFRIASYKMLQQPSASTRDGQDETQNESMKSIQKEGLALLKKLAESDHGDGICAYATALNEGRAGLDINPKAAVSWWMHASRILDHTQSNYELGVAFYTGEGVVEDEATAVHYFRRAADSGHAGASYMLGDCLLDGVGVERDRGEALEWLIIAGELGHRGARSRVLAVLMKDEEDGDYGEFTDGSRQTLISDLENKSTGSCSKSPKGDDDEIQKENDSASFSSTDNTKNTEGVPSYPGWDEGKKRDGLERQYSLRPVTLEHRFTIGGGANNPAVLGRRKSIVGESRHTH